MLRVDCDSATFGSFEVDEEIMSECACLVVAAPHAYESAT